VVTGSVIAILPIMILFLFLQRYWQGALPSGSAADGGRDECDSARAHRPAIGGVPYGGDYNPEQWMHDMATTQVDGEEDVRLRLASNTV
jgi:hypothetical protein